MASLPPRSKDATPALAKVVAAAKKSHSADEQKGHIPNTARPPASPTSPSRRSNSLPAPPGTPSTRSTFSYLLSAPSASYKGKAPDHQLAGAHLTTEPAIEEESPADVYRAEFVRADSDFRGPFEYQEQEPEQKSEVGGSNWFDTDTWNPRKWLAAGGTRDDSDKEPKAPAEKPVEEINAGASLSVQEPSKLKRSSSTPHPRNFETFPRWKRIMSLLPSSKHRGAPPPSKSVAAREVNITDELAVGGLAGLTVGLWFDRDERGYRRVPILLHRLRIRVSDSIHPLHGSRAVFRIECEYANGAARWVVYRQLRDFHSMHTHYAVANYYSRSVDLPAFPRTSAPYFHRLRKDFRARDEQLGRPEFAKLQREALENYLAGLIKAVMFLPAANRLCRFLEISALTIGLAPSGSSQLKGGLLKIHATSSTRSEFGRKGLSWFDKRKTRWCTVRESYLVVAEEQGEMIIHDVFLLDSDFKIERPKRYYRKGLRAMHLDDGDDNGVTRHEKDEDKHHHHHHREHHTVPAIREPGQGADGTTGSGFLSVFRSMRKHKAASVGDRPRSVSISSSSSSSSGDSGTSTPSETDTIHQLDPSTNTNPLAGPRTPGIEISDIDVGGALGTGDLASKDQKVPPKKAKKSKDTSRHTFFIENSQTRLKLVARSERQMQQWIAALEKMSATSHWSGTNRFDSFAPIRLNVAAQWLVDGRDYFWNLSRAILLAKECIYIHDWWLSPELHMRRPNKAPYRLDYLLKKKAEQGVKVYIIVYKEVSSRTTPTDSNHAKTHLIGLHPNIMMQRSPSHAFNGTFYWAHHEKMCVIDEAIAFMGGVDLCFGRWDTAQHVLIDDGDPTEGELEGTQIWPGKDYSNPRVGDFHDLNKPEQDMYDRAKTPRMPWHDIGLQVVGQPARDLCRHFVQRWNYLLRIKNHSRQMPFLIPPPDFRPADLEAQGLTGTCEMQICRSAGPWSMGTSQRIEHSIQNAYLKAIQLSEHFVYIENQFFITSTIVADVEVENQIGDALVSRIVRAHREGTKWKAVVMIPLLPGFSFPVDSAEASAIRIILEAQNRTISRGPNSIFGRLRKEGIDPDEYITFFSLRGWGKLPGNVLTTEQVYIHAKVGAGTLEVALHLTRDEVMIVDDRLAIIGSANINERSQRGDRDSELAAVLRDTDMIDGMMDGKPFKVGRFAHTLRVRLMREHLGVDVDAIYEEDLMNSEPVAPEHEVQAWDPDHEQGDPSEGVTNVRRRRERAPLIGTAVGQIATGFQEAASTGVHQLREKLGIKGNHIDAAPDDSALEQERRMTGRDGKEKDGFPGSVVPTLEEKTVAEHRPHNPEGKDKPIMDVLDSQNSTNKGKGRAQAPEQARVGDGTGELFGAPAYAAQNPQTDNEPPHPKHNKDDTDEQEKAAVGARKVIRQHLEAGVGASPWTVPTPAPTIDPHGFTDPIADKFLKDVWISAAVHNTEVYRKVFHAIPDDLVTTWKQYKDFIMHHDRLLKPTKETHPPPPSPQPVGRVPEDDFFGGNQEPHDKDVTADDVQRKDGRLSDAGSKSKEPSHGHKEEGDQKQHESEKGGTTPPPEKERRRATGNEPFEDWEREEMETLLRQVRGHIVIFPNRFLEGEDISNNFLFNADRIMPIQIYN